MLAMQSKTTAHTNPSPPLEFARSELLGYLGRMLPAATPANVHIRFSVAGRLDGLPPPRDAKLDDQYCITAQGTDIVISATNERSILLGVYRLLHELGCRFLSPIINNEVVPRIAPADLQVDLSEAASFRHRGVCIEGADSVENITDFIAWLPKLGCNSFFVQHMNPESFLANWYKHIYNPTLHAEAPADEDYAAMFRQIDAAIAQRGLLHHRVGHGWTSMAIGYHHVCAQSGADPTETQAAMLAQVNGKRAFWQGVPSNTNLCYSRARPRAAFIHSVVDYACAHPEVDYLHVWLADEYNNICECPECQAATPTDQYVSMLNAIDAQLTVKGVPTRIALLLYQELLWPPIREKLNNPDRFTLMFAPISRTFEKSYADHGAIPPLPDYKRNQIELPHTLEENLAFLNAWQRKVGAMDSFVYDYPLGRAHYGDLGYVHIASVISRDIKSLPTLGLNGYISCQELRAGFPNTLPNYVMGLTLWNCQSNFDDLAAEYFDAAYGRDGRAVLQYLSRLSELSSCDYYNGIGPRKNMALSEAYQGAVKTILAFRPHIAEALQKADTPQNFFWRLLDYHAEYCTLISEALAYLAAGNTGQADDVWKNFVTLIRRKEPDTQPYLDVYRVIEVSTKYTGFAPDAAE